MRELRGDVIIVGGGVGGVAAALGALAQGRSVVLSEEAPWLGGQLTSQAVPPDQNPWIAELPPTRSYGRFADGVRDFYRAHYPLTDEAARLDVLNPGNGHVSKLCHEPRVALAVIEQLLAPYRATGRLTVLEEHEPVAAETEGDRVSAVTLRSRRTGDEVVVHGPYFLDATEEGQLLELAAVEHVFGAESKAHTGEPHAVDGPAEPMNQQALSWCFAMDFRAGEDHTIERPRDYDFWAAYTPGDYWPGPLLAVKDVHPVTLEVRDRSVIAAADSVRGGQNRDLWHFRRILDSSNFAPGAYPSDVTLVNWPQIDYMAGPLLGVDAATRNLHLEQARQQSLSYLYWLQTECPRHDGGNGYPELRARGDLLGSDDHLAQRPYIRESRRIAAEFTVLEQHVGVQARRAAGMPAEAEQFGDTVGVGSYRLDLHPSTGNGSGPRNYIDISTHPFQVPLGAMIPVRMENLIPAAKNIGTTHITNGCYRLHPVEWVIGEVAGSLAAHALATGETPRAIRNDRERRERFQQLLSQDGGVLLAWPDHVRVHEN